jgi:ABC-type multidrug transport system fused ATPase/permease subunit
LEKRWQFILTWVWQFCTRYRPGYSRTFRFLVSQCDGAVCIDGNDIRSYTLQSLPGQISLVLQESLLFSGNILDNIAFSSPEATGEQVLAAVAANCRRIHPAAA